MMMTRPEFIKLVEADLRAQLRQVGWFVGLIMSFGLAGTALVKRGGETFFRLDSPELWGLLGLTIAFAVAAVMALKLTGRNLLKCPHCRKCIGGTPAQVVVGSGRCGFCGEVIIDPD